MARGRLAVPAGDLAPVLLQAEPEPLEIDLKRAAVIVVDMQNAFASKGGFLDLTGKLDISKIPKVVSHIEKITDAQDSHYHQRHVVAAPYPGLDNRLACDCGYGE